MQAERDLKEVPWTSVLSFYQKRLPEASEKDEAVGHWGTTVQ